MSICFLLYLNILSVIFNTLHNALFPLDFQFHAFHIVHSSVNVSNPFLVLRSCQFGLRNDVNNQLQFYMDSLLKNSSITEKKLL